MSQAFLYDIPMDFAALEIDPVSCISCNNSALPGPKKRSPSISIQQRTLSCFPFAFCMGGCLFDVPGVEVRGCKLKNFESIITGGRVFNLHTAVTTRSW